VLVPQSCGARAIGRLPGGSSPADSHILRDFLRSAASTASARKVLSARTEFQALVKWTYAERGEQQGPACDAHHRFAPGASGDVFSTGFFSGRDLDIRATLRVPCTLASWVDAAAPRLR
jgi:hypothetical protein